MTQFLSLDALLQTLGWTLIHSLWQGCLVAMVVAILLFSYRQHTAQVRYWIAYGGMLVLLLATATTFGVLWAAQNAANTEGGIWAENAWILAGSNAAQVADNQTFVQKMGQSAVTFFNAHLTEISSAWLLGFLFFSVRLAVSWAILRGRRRAQNVILDSDFWQLPLQRLLRQLSERQLSIRRPVRLVAAAWTLVPLTVGWLKPVIFIPLSILNHLSPTEVEAILAHELAHIAHRDYLLNFLQALVETVFYYHPAVWWLSAVIRTEREMRCDAIAIALCNDDKIGYAKTLVRLQEHAQQALHTPPQLALAFGNRPSPLARRVKHLFFSPVKSSFIMERITITSLLVACLFFFSFVKKEVENNKNDLQNTPFVSKTRGETSQSNPQNPTTDLTNPKFTEGGILGQDSAPEALMRARFEAMAAEKTPIVDFQKGGFVVLTDTTKSVKYTQRIYEKSDAKAFATMIDVYDDEHLSDADKKELWEAMLSQAEKKSVHIDTIPNVSNGEEWEKINGKWVMKSKPSIQPAIVNPPIPPNALPGRCYAYCYLPDGSPASEWKEVVCEDLKESAAFINALRDKLIATGDLSPSHIDRALTKEVKTAIMAYQKRNKLPMGNLNEPTITHMGIEMPRHPAPKKKE